MQLGSRPSTSGFTGVVVYPGRAGALFGRLLDGRDAVEAKDGWRAHKWAVEEGIVCILGGVQDGCR